MTVKAVFVGVSKHLDPTIGELGGARRDATALWALFSDTIAGLAPRLLLDQDATHAEITRSVLGTLDSASEADVVVITFAGHGSPDGRLIAFDTQSGDLKSTGVAMSDLADAFKATKARAVLCILDCCFSGHAPARVLEVQAIPRNALSLADIYGEGRILLSACAANEEAYEQTGSGHGLLTNAVIHAWTNSADTAVSFPELVGEIIRLTRVEAAVTISPRPSHRTQSRLCRAALPSWRPMASRQMSSASGRKTSRTV